MSQRISFSLVIRQMVQPDDRNRVQTHALRSNQTAVAFDDDVVPDAYRVIESEFFNARNDGIRVLIAMLPGIVDIRQNFVDGNILNI